MSDIPGYLTCAEVADLLQLSRQRVRQVAQELHGLRLGREWVFPVKAVEAYQKKPRKKRGWVKGRPRKQ